MPGHRSPRTCADLREVSELPDRSPLAIPSIHCRSPKATSHSLAPTGMRSWVWIWLGHPSDRGRWRLGLSRPVACPDPPRRQPLGSRAGRLDRACALWTERRWALEDCRHLSRRLEGDLVRGGETVVRVPPKLMAEARRSSREPGKSDPIDALAVARAALREPDLPTARLDGVEREVRLLVDHRETSWPSVPVLRTACAGTSTS